MNMAYRLIAFDMDGTLYPDYRLELRVLPFVLKNRAFFQAFRDVRIELRTRYSRSTAVTNLVPSKLEEFRSLQARLMARRLGLSEEEAADELERCAYRGLTEPFLRIKPFHGLIAVLDQLRARGYRLALLSDLPVHEKLQAFGLQDYFEIKLCAEETGSLKPDPLSFEFLLSKAGLAGGEMLYGGNSVPMDLGGAAAAKIDCALITRKKIPGARFTFVSWPRFFSSAQAAGLDL